MYLNRILTVFFFFVSLCLFSCSDETPQTGHDDPSPETHEQIKETQLIIYFKDGTHVAYPLYKNPQLSFVDAQLVVKTSIQEVKYDLQTISRFTYE